MSPLPVDRTGRIALGLSVAIAAVVLLLVLRRGWIPVDEGCLLEGARRVRAGELPHRDFDAIYTGGLEALHALALAALGDRMLSLRVPLVLAALAVVPLLYGLLARALPPAAAAAVTVTAVLWGVPTYVAAMPSWYGLFLAIGALWATVRFVEDRRARWLVLAGACAGVSVAVKVTGLFTLAAVLLALVHDEQVERVDPTGMKPASSSRPWLPVVAVIALGLALCVAVLLRGRPDAATLAHLALPVLALATAVVVHELRLGSPSAALGERGRALGGRTGWVLLGFAVPVLALAAPYALTGSLGDLWEGCVVRPQRRVGVAAMDFPPATTLVAWAPLVVLALRPAWLSSRVALALGALGLGVLLATGADGYAWAWHLLRGALPAASLGAAALATRSRDRRDVTRFACASALALWGLVQFPFSFAQYACYASSLAFVAWGHLAAAAPTRRPHALVLGFAAGFVLLWVLPGEGTSYGIEWRPARPRVPLDLPSCGIEVPGGDAELARWLVATIDAHAAPGAAIYAAPDAPMVHALTGRPSPTRTLFDALDADFGQPGRTARVLGELEARGVDVVVVNLTPRFSGPLDPALGEALAARYPRAVRRDPLIVLWREPREDDETRLGRGLHGPGHRVEPPLRFAAHRGPRASLAPMNFMAPAAPSRAQPAGRAIQPLPGTT